MTYESRFHNEESNRCIWRETFNSEHDVRRNGGVPDNVTFGEGMAEFTYDIAFLSYIEYQEFPSDEQSFTGPLTVELLIKPTNYGMGFGFSSRIFHNGELSMGLIGSGDDWFWFSSNGSDFTNTATESVTLNQWNHIVASRQADGTVNLYINGQLSGDADQDSGTPEPADETLKVVDPNFQYVGFIDKINVFNYEMTAEEVKNLYETKTYKQLSLPSPILDISAQSGSIVDRFGLECIGTSNIQVVKDGEIKVIKFIDDTSYADFGDDFDVRSIGSYEFWFCTPASRESRSKYIICSTFSSFSNIYYNSSSSGIIVEADTNGQTVSWSNCLEQKNRWYHIVVVRNEDNSTLYVNGISQGEDSEVGMDNLSLRYLGNNNASSLSTKIGLFCIYDELLTTQQVAQLYSSKRKKYNV